MEHPNGPREVLRTFNQHIRPSVERDVKASERSVRMEVDQDQELADQSQVSEDLPELVDYDSESDEEGPSPQDAVFRSMVLGHHQVVAAYADDIIVIDKPQKEELPEEILREHTTALIATSNQMEGGSDEIILDIIYILDINYLGQMETYSTELNYSI